jgi:protein TonB
MNPRTLDEKTPGLSQRWRRPLLGSVAVHTLLLGAIVLVLMPHVSPHRASGSTAAVTTLFLQKPPIASTAAPTPARQITVAPVPPKTAPMPEEGVPVLAAHPKPAAAPSPQPVAAITPRPERAKEVHPARLRAKPAVAVSAAHVAPVASSYAPGEEVFAHPPYPEEARERGDAGTVKVNVAFDAGGRVADVEITQSSGSLILDHQTAAFIRANWHSAAEAGQVVCVPVRYSLENL